jgi:6,7-dimethyl-8-ribityllumazine synthase
MTAAYPLSADGASPTGRIAFIQSTWHRQLVDKTHEGFLGELEVLGFSPGLVDRWELPGAFEIPLHAKRLARTGRYAAIVAAGLVVDGGIYRHEFVAETVIRALMRVQLDFDVPIFSAVLTPHHFHEHDVHQAFFAEHLVKKGQEAARACAATLDSLNRIPACA